MLYLIYLSGVVWCLPLVLFAPSVWRIWRGRPSLIDIMLSPMAFISANQIGYCLRWTVFHDQVPDMGPGELAVWAVLYVLSIGSALSAVVAWRTARRWT